MIFLLSGQIPPISLPQMCKNNFIYPLKFFRRSKQMFSHLWNFSEGRNKCFRISETFQKVETNVFASLKLFRRSKQIFSRLWNISEGQNKCFRVSEIFQKVETNIFTSLKFFRRPKQMFSCLWNFSEGLKKYYLTLLNLPHAIFWCSAGFGGAAKA